ncbi:divalent cation tolerance protein CutA [Candidatus Micrarchaeota archaeon]|nr:divalent cation tolerance protein CutA [Candidatus Micrarchaeota archaeon]
MIIALSTYPEKEKAEEAAKEIIKEELAACVSIVKIENSIYRHKGKLENHPEYMLVIKTTRKAYTRLEMYIKEHHPYEIPEILYLKIGGGSKEYIQWMDSMTLSRLLRVPLDLRGTSRASEPERESTKDKKPRTLSA